MTRAEMVPTGFMRPVHARQRHLCLAGGIPRFGRLKAGVAIAARLASLAKIAEQTHTPARRRFAKTKQRVELAALHALVGIVRVRFVDHLALLYHVAETVCH